MRTQTPQELFEQTRARIQSLTKEIEDLSSQSRDPRQFFNGFLDRLVAALSAQGAAIWIHSLDGFTTPYHRNLSSSDYPENPRQTENIHLVLADVLKAQRPYLVAAMQPDLDPGASSPQSSHEEIGNTRPHPFFYIPISAGDEVLAILQVWLPSAGDPKTYHDILSYLKMLCGYAGAFLKNQQSGILQERNRQGLLRLRLAEALLGEWNQALIETALVHHLVDMTEASRCCLFRRARQSWRLAQVSNQEKVDSKSQAVLDLEALARFLPLSAEPAASDPSSEQTAPGISEALQKCGVTSVASIALRSRPELPHPDLLIVLEHRDGRTFTPAALQELSWAGTLFKKALQAAELHQSLPLLISVAKSMGRWKARRRALGLAVLAAAFALGTGALFLPWPLKIKTACTVYPHQVSSVLAESTGKIIEISVHEGASVESGQIIAKLDGREITTQLAVSEQDAFKWQAEANRFQAMGDDGQRKIAEINLERAQKAIQRLQYLLEKTVIRSPIKGIVLTKNLINRQGEWIESGKIFCEVADAGTCDLIIDIDQRDVGIVSEELESKGAIPVEYILHAFASETLSTRLSGIEALSSSATPKPQGSIFHAYAPIDASDARRLELKPGYSGKAKLTLEKRFLGVVLIRRFVDYWRVEWAL